MSFRHVALNCRRYLATSVTPKARKFRVPPAGASRDLETPLSLPTRSQPAQNKPPPDAPKRLLQPYTLSLRLKTLCNEGLLDAALDMLRNAARGAQNTKVWNTLISEYLKANKFRAAYSLFIEMKRRGYKPNTMTFQTMFSGFSRVSDWQGHSKRLASVHALYDHFLRHLEKLKDAYPQSRNLTVSPLASYIKILGDVGDYQRMFDVYYALDQLADGALAPNEFIFAAMFQVISERRTPSSSDHPSVHVQNASDAKLLWKQMLKVSEKSPSFLIDSHILTPAIHALSRGHPADQEYALDMVKDHLGLAKSKDAIPRNPCLTPSSLNAALWLCIHMRKYELCLEIFEQARDYHTKTDAVIDRGHVEAIFRALNTMTTPESGRPRQALQILEWTLEQAITGTGGPRILPTVTTYNMLLLVCWRGRDWPTAARVFELMTGYSARDFEDGRDSSKELVVQKRSHGRNLVPDAQTMQHMIRTASVTRNTAHMRQSLRMAERVGIQKLLGFAPLTGPRFRTQRQCPEVELASVIKQAVDHVSRNSPKPSTSDKTLWDVLRLRASDVLRHHNQEKSQRPAGSLAG